MAIRVAIIDDCDLTVLGTCVVLGKDHRFKVIGRGSSLVDLLWIIHDTPPDVILLNEWFPNTDVLSAVEEVQTAVPLARAIVTGTLVEGLPLHCHRRDVGYPQPIRQRQQITRHRLELVHLTSPFLLLIRHNPTRNYRLLVNIQPSTVRIYDFQLKPPPLPHRLRYPEPRLSGCYPACSPPGRRHQSVLLRFVSSTTLRTGACQHNSTSAGISTSLRTSLPIFIPFGVRSSGLLRCEKRECGGKTG